MSGIVGFTTSGFRQMIDQTIDKQDERELNDKYQVMISRI
jgi:hypothetical protein